MLLKLTKQQKKEVEGYLWKRGKCHCGKKFYEGQTRGFFIQVLSSRAVNVLRKETIDIHSFCNPCMLMYNLAIKKARLKNETPNRA